MSEVEHLVNEAMKLSGPERAELMERLLEMVTAEDVHATDPKIEAAWREEVRRRSARLRAGEATTTPWEVARREIFGR